MRFPGIGIFGEPTAGAIEGADLVVMAVKPQQMRAAAQALAPFMAGIPVVLTIAAGTRVADLARWLGGYARIVRAMPNTPALVGAGISGAFASDAVDVTQRALADRVLEAAGAVVWVEREDMLDAVTGVSGSGPAYVVLLPRSAGGGRARARLRARRRAPPRLPDVRRRAEARAVDRSRARDAARTGHVEGRHHGARARGARGARA